MKSNLPERNEPCLCGSGKKFKKCCLLTLDAEIDQFYLQDLQQGQANLQALEKERGTLALA
jgi:hypothetical protein